MSLNAKNDIASRIEGAVFELMATTPVQSIKVTDVLRLAHTSKSTFYRCYRSVDDVVKRFEDELLQNMQDINDVALEARFGDAQLDPTPTMIKRMEILKAIARKSWRLTAITVIPCLHTRQRSSCMTIFAIVCGRRFQMRRTSICILLLRLRATITSSSIGSKSGLTLRHEPLPPRSIACSTHRSLSTMHRAIGIRGSLILKSRSGERLFFRDERLRMQ